MASSASLMAQTSAPPAPALQNEKVVLDTFTVSVDRDQGYVAVDSLAGGRQNTPLRLTPSAVSALTSEFISDLGITDMQDALQWSLNVAPTNFRAGNAGGTGGGTFNFWSVSIRGDAHVQGGNPPTKNYFPTYMVIDSYNVDRIEFNSGPNSILFGIGDIGGSVATYTKNPRFDKNFTTVNMRINDSGGWRGTIDTNAVAGNVAARVNAVWANEKGWVDGDFDKRKGVDVGLSYKLGDNTTIRLGVEGWKQKRNLYTTTVGDGLSLWNGTTNAATWGQAIAGTGDNPVTTPGAPGVKTMDAWGGPNDYLVFIPGMGLMNWAHGLRSAGTGDFYDAAKLRDVSFVDGRSGKPVPALPSREFAVAPSDGVLEPQSLSGTISFEHRINANSEFQIQGYKYVDKAQATNFEGAGGGMGFGVAVDLNKQLPNGQPNPNYGKLYSDQFLDRQKQNHRVDEIRGQYTYHFDTQIFGIPWTQSLSASAGYQKTDYDARQYQAVYKPTYVAADWTKSMVWGRIYWDNPQAAFNVENNGDIAYVPHTFNWFDFNSTQKIKYAGLFSQSRFWDDRLNITLGARRDDYKNNKIGLRGPVNTPTISEDSGDTYSAGVVGYVTEWLALVGNYSSNFQPAAGGLAPAVTGKIFGPSFGKGKDFGVRVSTKDHKYSAGLNFYRTRSTDVTGADQPGFQGIWDQYFKAGGTKTDIGPAGQVTGTAPNLKASMNSVDSYDVKYKGVEFELTANPTRNIRLIAHYSEPEGVRTNNAPNARIYFAQHLPDWQAIANGTTPDAILLRSNLADAQRLLDNTAGSSVSANMPTKMANAFATYSFLDGSVKGLEIGAGANYFGKQFAGPGDLLYGERVMKPGYTLVSAMIAYTMKFPALGRDVRARFQLNVDNVLDEDSLIFDGYQTFGSAGIQGNGYRFLNPRSFTLSANFEF